jgi:hypothetical protein
MIDFLHVENIYIYMYIYIYICIWGYIGLKEVRYTTVSKALVMVISNLIEISWLLS